MEIKVLGTGCKKCNETEELVKKIVAENNVDATVEKVSDLQEIARFGVMLTPSVVIDGKVKIVGKVPKEKEILALLGL